MEQDQYEARLKELFDSFDTTGTGSLGQEELTDLCHMLQLEEVAPSLQQALLQDNPHGRVHFDQFKEALIDVLSSSVFNKENCPEPDGSPEAQPKYIKDGKRYGRRSMPELQDSLEEFDEETVIEAEDEGTRSSQVSSRNCEELWRNEGEEYEAEGQLRFWNPDDLNASQSTLSPEQDWVEEKLQLICEDLGITRDGHLNRKKLLSICEQYGFQNLDKEALEDVLQNLDHDDTVSLQDFFYEVCKNTKPPTPSSSTPYRQLKRHLSLQPYDESGRRTLTPSAMSGTIGLRLFSKFDDGTGYGSVEDIIDLWHEEGIVNGQAILKALDFSLEGKISLTELAMTLENELLITKNEIYQAALISFRSEIRHLLERADQAAREKDKLRSDLDKNEKLKSLMASEVDDHHADIERRNEYNLRKLDEEYKERTAALRSELRKEREQLLQQAGRHRLELEQELDKVRMEENYLRDRLTLCIKENTRMENELLETTEKLVDCETLTSKLQRSLDNILREKFGDLDPSCAEFFRQEERLLQVRNEYERQRRELQDRIDELQLELEDYRSQGLRRIHSPLKSSLFEEMDNNNAVDYDQGIGTEDCPPLNMSIEAEMAIEHMREQHQREVEHLTLELESKTVHYEDNLKEAKHVFEKEQEALKEKLNAEVHKAEEQIRVFKMRHSELESEMQRLKDDQQRAEHEHQERLATMETEFTLQKQQLVEKEASLQLQLEEARQSYHQEKEELLEKEASLQLQLEKARQTYHQEKEELVEKEASLQLQLEKARQTYHQEKEELVEKEASLQLQLEEARQTYHQEKEDLVQRAEDIEKEAEARLVELVTTYEEKRNQLEQSFQEQILSFQEKHEREKEDLRKELSEHLQQEAHEERKEMETEYSKRILETKSKYALDLEMAEEKHKEAMANLERKCKNDIQELHDQHAEEKTQWAFGKEELVQENLERQERLKEELEKEKLLRFKLSQEKENLLETHKNLKSEKDQVQKEWDNLKVRSKQVEDDLAGKILQLESDLQEELTERDEQLCQAEKEVKYLRETLEKLDRQHNIEKEQLNAKLAMSEALHKMVCEKTEKKQSELIGEISRLQNLISELKAEISSLSTIQKEYEQMEKEKVDLKNIAAEFQSNLGCVEDKKNVFQNLHNVYEQTVQEKTELLKEVSELQTRLEEAKSKISRARSHADSQEKTVQSLEIALLDKDDKLGQLEEKFTSLKSTLEKVEQQHKLEKDELYSKLSVAEGLYKDVCDRTEKKRFEMIEEITRLQKTIHELKDEITSLSKIQAEFKLMVKENSDLKNIASQLQKCSASLEEKKRAHKNLHHLHEQMVKENMILQSEIVKLKKKMDLVANEVANVHLEVEEGKGESFQASELKLIEQEEQVDAEKNIPGLEATVEKLESHYKAEDQILQTKLSKSEKLYRNLDDGTNTKRQEMLVEINRLQSTINELQNEISSLANIQQECALIKRENEDLKREVSHLEEERSVLKSLKRVHEDTVQENVRLMAEVSKLQEKLAFGKVMEDNPTNQNLLYDLREKTELCQAETHIQVLHETLETIEQDRQAERECFRTKLLQSEELYRVACNEAEKSRENLARLKSTVETLENKVAGFKNQDECRLLERENNELKLGLSESTNASVFLDEEGVFRNLQTSHEQTVKENVRLLAEMSQLQKKLDLLDHAPCEEPKMDHMDEMDDHHIWKPQPLAPMFSKAQEDVANSEYKKTLDSINIKLQKKTKELEDTTKVLCQLEKGYSSVKTENDHLRTQVVSLQEKLNNLSLEYDQVKKAVHLESIALPELENATITIPGLKLLLAVAKKENLHLQENLKSMELRNSEAIENNNALSSEVSWLQKEIQNMEEITAASLKLENLFDEAKKENDELKSLVHIMQEKIFALENRKAVNSSPKNKGIQTVDLKAEAKEQDAKHQQELSPRGTKIPKSSLQKGKMQISGVLTSEPDHKDLHNSLGVLVGEDTTARQSKKAVSHKATGEDAFPKGGLQESTRQQESLSAKAEWNKESVSQSKTHDVQKMVEHLRSENKALIEERTALTAQVTDLKEESENLNQKISELLDACEELWRNLESIQNEKVALEKTVTEMRSRNEQLMSENDVLFRKNSKNQEDLQDLNHRLMAFLKQKDRKDPAKGSEEWQKERGHLREELEGCRSKIFDYEEELSQVKVHHRFLEQENILLRQEMETKQLAKCSEITDLKNEMSHLLDKSEKLMREKETLEEELSSCVAKSAKVSYLEKKLSGLKQEQKTWEQQSNSLRSQLTQSQEKVQNLDESLQGVNLQLSRIKSDLRVAQQEKEALKQEVMSLHKQLQNSNTKKQVLERALQSSGLQNQHKKQYWDDLEQLMGQEQHLLRQENERLQRELINAKTDLTQTREKVRQLESTVISLKHQKQMNQSSLVKALEQEKSSLRRECDQLQLELTSANRKISQLSGLEREVETLKTENDGLRTKQGKYDDHLKEMLHSPTSQSHSHSQLQQPATVPRDHYQQLQQQATVPRDHYLQLQHQLQQAERRNQQLQAAMDNTPQALPPEQRALHADSYRRIGRL
ncbi:ninein isoform X2 [Hyperolius riggenbachi]|uniref:ninein isoform X2 n=1 Tax=Hyperolius riggenbachi TaxID=752182 RepID=UPI0035A303C4